MKPKNTILLLKRKSNSFSIEKTFDLLLPTLANKFKVDTITAVSEYEKPLPLLKNIVYFFYHLYLKQNKFNIYHVTGVLHYLFPILPKKRSILTIHDCIKYHQHTGIKRLIVKYLWFKFPTKRFTYITVVSEKTKKELIQITNCNPDKILIIKNALDPQIKPSPKEFKKDKPNILHIGTNYNKNLPNLIEALKGIKCHLTIVGRLNKDILQQLQLTRIEYSNFYDLTNSQLIKLYNESDIVSFITLYEGFGLPIIEAQGTGRVVITSDILPHTEIGGNGALYVNPVDVFSIHEAIKKIIVDDNLRQKLILNGYENIKQFDVKKITYQYIDLYNSLL